MRRSRPVESRSSRTAAIPGKRHRPRHEARPRVDHALARLTDGGGRASTRPSPASPGCPGGKQGCTSGGSARLAHTRGATAQRLRPPRRRFRPGAGSEPDHPAGDVRTELPDPTTRPAAQRDVLVPLHEGQRGPAARAHSSHRGRQDPARRGHRVSVRVDPRSAGVRRSGAREGPQGRRQDDVTEHSPAHRSRSSTSADDSVRRNEKRRPTRYGRSWT